jgi:hypothetical protein
MATHEEKAYLHCRLNLIMELVVEVVQEISKWETETSKELEGE